MSSVNGRHHSPLEACHRLYVGQHVRVCHGLMQAPCVCPAGFWLCLGLKFRATILAWIAVSSRGRLLSIVRGPFVRCNRRGTAFVLIQFHSLCHSIHEAIHALSFCWILERHFMPTSTAASEQRLTIEDAIALEPGDLNPSFFHHADA